MKRVCRLTIIIIMLIILLYNHNDCYSDSLNLHDNIYLLITNKLTLHDIEQMPNLMKIREEGSIGLMNVRGYNSYNNEEGFITINASNKAIANMASSQFFNINGEIIETYENRVGTPVNGYDIANIGIGKLYNQNYGNRYSPHIGLLGDVFHKNGLKTAIFGNGDTTDETIRDSALIPMDSNGLIDYGNIDDILIYDNKYPYGLKTDYNKLLYEVLDIRHKAALIVIDTGDLGRLNRYGEIISEKMFFNMRGSVLKDIDDFILNLSASIDKNRSLLMILSPNSGEERIDGNRLSPIILWGRDIPRGIPISSTTKRSGLISNLDINPTIVDFVGVESEDISGNIIRFQDWNNSYDYVKGINGRINLTSGIRTRTLNLYGVLGIILTLSLMFLFLFRINLNQGFNKGLKIILLLLYKFPLILIVISLFKIDNISDLILISILITAISIYILNRYFGNEILYFVSYSYFILFGLDVLTKGFFTRYSVISYDPIIGARYFGIGNEMAGLYLAGTNITAGLLYDRYKKQSLSAFILFLSIIIVGYPRLGANFGALIALISANLYLISNIGEQRFEIKRAMHIVAIVGFIIIIFGFFDVRLNANPTHFGKTILLIRSKGFKTIKNIIIRKVLMNVKLIGISLWTKIMFVNLLAQMGISILFEDRIRKLMDSNIGKPILSIFLGSIIGFIINDSGLLLSALAINLVTIFVLFYIFDTHQGNIE